MTTNKTLSELVRQLQGGYDVFQELWEHTWVQNMVRRECRRLWGTPKEEVEQSCRIAMWKLLKGFNPVSDSAVVSHLNVFIPFEIRKSGKVSQSNRHYVSIESLPNYNDILQSQNERETYSELLDCLLSRLSIRERSIAVLLADGWTQEEISMKTGIHRPNIARYLKKIRDEVEQVIHFPTFHGLSTIRREEAVNVRRILADRCALSNDLKTEDIMTEQSALISKLSRVKTPEDMDSFNKALSSFTVHYNTLLWELFGADEGEWTRTKNIAA